jgi:hypothetical protein
MHDGVYRFIVFSAVGLSIAGVPGCAGLMSHSSRSLIGSEGLVDVAPPSSSPTGKAQANAPVKLGVPATRLKPPAPPLAVQSAVRPAESKGESRDAINPPTLSNQRTVAESVPDPNGFLLPAKLKKADSKAQLSPPALAKSSASSSLPADVAALLSTDLLDRPATAKKTELSEPAPLMKQEEAVQRTGDVAHRIPRAQPRDGADRGDVALRASSKGVSLTGISEVESDELIDLLTRVEGAGEIQTVAHETPVPEPAMMTKPEATLSPEMKPRAVALQDVPPLKPEVAEPTAGAPFAGPPPMVPPAPVVASPAPISSSLKPGATPAVDSKVVLAVADADSLAKSKVVPASSVASELADESASADGDASKAGELKVDRFHFCTEINGFASTVSRPLSPMNPGERLLAYVEVMNFESVQLGELFETKLSCRMKLEDSSGQVVFSQDFGDVVDRCVGRRKDFFCHFLLTVPDTLAPGSYRWRLSITDQTSKQTREQTLNAEIGSGEPGERNGP